MQGLVTTRRSRAAVLWMPVLVLGVLLLSVLSLFIGVSEVSPWAVLTGGVDAATRDVLLISRIPRTLALVLTGMAMAVAGSLMQMLARNRFVEPSTAGTVESASLGVLVVALAAPELPLFWKMLVAAGFALAGTALFLAVLRSIPLRSALIVPLVGLVLGGVINAVTTFFAHRYDMLQSLSNWTTGDFSSVLRGRYELLWIGLGLTALAYVAADRFTVLGLGEDFATNAGLDHRRLVALGLAIVAVITASVVVTAGVVPFLGLIVPNIVSLVFGDRMRRALPWTALLGAVFVLACDIAGRLLLFPYEVPIGTVVGIVGSVLFLAMLLRGRSRWG